MSDLIRMDFKIYLEPVLGRALNLMAEKYNTTRSKYIRGIMIKELIREKYPLNKVSNKFNGFYQALRQGNDIQ